MTAPILGDGSAGDPVRLDPNFSGGDLIADGVFDDFTSLVDGATKEFTLSEAPISSSVFVILDGIVQRPDVDYELDGPLVTMSSAPDADSSSFFASYLTEFSTINFITWTSTDPYTYPAGDGAAITGRGYALAKDDDTNSGTYTVMLHWVYNGSDNVGPITVAYANIYRSAVAGTCDVRIYDATNALVVDEVTGVNTPTTTNIVTFSSVSNVPTSPAIFELQLRRSSGGTNCFSTGVAVEF